MLGLSVATLALLAVLIGLGVWQLERLQWKLALIARVESAMKAPPVSIRSAMGGVGGVVRADQVARADYRRVRVQGRFLSEKEIYFFTTAPDGAPVLHVLAPFECPDGTILVDRGYIPLERRNAFEQPPIGERELVGNLRAPLAPSFFAPAPDRLHRTFYARDLQAMAQFLGIGRAFPMFLDADATPNPGGWPKGGQTQVNFRNEHLQYAITWFSLAVALLSIYLIYHVSKGRLGLRSREEGK